MIDKKFNFYFKTILFIVPFLLFINTLNHDFAWDDKIVVTENTRVQEGITGIPELFVKSNSQMREDKYGYRPITLTAFAIEYSLFQLNPKGFHFVNILLFSILCLIIYKTLRRIFEDTKPTIVFLITLIFAVSPIHTEVVANIKSLDEILALLFSLISLNYFLNYYESSKIKHILFAVFFFSAAFLSKESAIMFLIIIPLTVLLFRNVNQKRILILSGILGSLSILLIYFFFISIQNKAGVEKTAGMGIIEENNILGNSFFHMGLFSEKIANVMQLNLLYLRNFFIPTNLTYYNGLGHIKPYGLHWITFLGGAVFISMIGFAVLKIKKYPIIAYGILFYFITLSIFFHIAVTLADTMADRFAFVPSLGLCISFVGLLDVIFKSKSITQIKNKTISFSMYIKNEIGNNYGLGILVLVIIFFSVLTFNRNTIWKDDFTLVTSDMDKLSNSARPNYFYASLLYFKLQADPDNQELERNMIQHYRRSISLSDDIYYGRIELATYLCMKQRFAEGTQLLEETIKLFPNSADTYRYLGQAHYTQKRYKEAAAAFRKSIELAPNLKESYNYLIFTLAETGEYTHALQLAESNLQKFPGSEISYYDQLGYIYYKQGKIEQSTQATLNGINYGAVPYDVYAKVIGRYQTLKDDVNTQKYYNYAVNSGIMKK